jgi:hypothetical protein
MSFREKMGKYAREVRSKVVSELMEAITESLGLGRHYLSSQMKEAGFEMMLLSSYPPPPPPVRSGGGGGDDLRCGNHTGLHLPQRHPSEPRRPRGARSDDRGVAPGAAPPGRSRIAAAVPDRARRGLPRGHEQRAVQGGGAQDALGTGRHEQGVCSQPGELGHGCERGGGQGACGHDRHLATYQYNIPNGPGTIDSTRHGPKKHDPSPARGTINSA